MSGCKTLYIDYSLCIGCETCEYVCRFTNDTSRIHMTRTIDGVMVPLYCQHCENPKCANACPRGALKRDKDGALILQSMLSNHMTLHSSSMPLERSCNQWLQYHLDFLHFLHHDDQYRHASNQHRLTLESFPIDPTADKKRVYQEYW